MRLGPGWSLLLRRCCFAACCCAAAGCGRPESAADRHAADLSDAIKTIQADQDRDRQRLGSSAAEPDAAQKREPGGQARGTPALRAVQLGDGEAGANDDPNDTSARPEIRLVGPPGAASRPAARAKQTHRGRGEARIEPSDGPRTDGARIDGPPPSPGEGAARSSVLDPEAKSSYEAALALVHGKQYDRGLDALTTFLTRWPDHPYAENATYWRGECLYAKGDYLRAAEQFEAVVARFGIGNKAPDALLKIGMCHERLGGSERAAEYWDRLKRDFPKSEAARKIPARGSDERPAHKTRGPKESR
jgi:tol-pal system protein YbgF